MNVKKGLLKVFKLLALLRVDVYLFLAMLTYAIVSVPTIQLIQDKICINEMKLGEDICFNLDKIGPAFEGKKSEILKKTTTIRNLQSIVSTLPAVVISLFIGSWIDLYPRHTRYLLLVNNFAAILQSVTLILQCIYFTVDPYYTIVSYLFLGLGGSMSLSMACVFTYVARTTRQKYRSIRFAVLDLFILSAIPLSYSLGAKILAATPWFANDNRNYIGFFLLITVILLFGCLWIFFFLRDCASFEKESTSSTDNLDHESTKQLTESPLTSFFAILNPQNILNTFKTCFRVRPGNGRAKVICIILSSCVIFMNIVAEPNIGFQYTEKVFKWDYQHYSNVNAILTALQSIATVGGTLLFSNLFAFSDPATAAIGTVSHIVCDTLKGIPLVWAYITGYAMYSLSGIAIPSSRSSLTFFIEPYEYAQVFTVLSCLQSIAPMLSSILTTEIFKATLNTIPGMTWHALAILLVFPLVIFIWVGWSERRSTVEEQNKSSESKVDSTDVENRRESKLDTVIEENENNNLEGK